MSQALAPVTAAGVALERHGKQPSRLSLDDLRPYVGILGVMVGAVIGLLGGRVTTFGLADLRGQLHAGFDEGAWITTSFGIGQMVVGVASPYLGAVFGIRRVLLLAISAFFLTSLIGPLSPNLPSYLAMQVIGGLASGTFIPLTISFVIRTLPARLVVYGLSVYAMNSEISQNVAASLEGWYADNWGWQWISWQYCLMLPAMFACIWYGVPREKINATLLSNLDWPGLAYAAGGFGMLYAALDQGNRLDWTRNGLIDGLLISGAILTAAFLYRELRTANPFLNLRLLLRGNVFILILLLAGFRFIILSTAYIIPLYLQNVQSFRELQVGAVLMWIALPQVLIVLPIAALLKRFDGRWVLAFGAGLISIACLMATQLTAQWATDDFLPSQILQAFGQSFALTALLVLVVRSISPADALSIGALLQISRLFGGEIGTAFMQTFVRVREQIHSNLLGLHIDTLSGLTNDRLLAYRNALDTRTTDLAQSAARGTRLLANAVAQQASILSYIDGFTVAAAGAFLCLLIAVIMRPSPPSPF